MLPLTDVPNSNDYASVSTAGSHYFVILLNACQDYANFASLKPLFIHHVRTINQHVLCDFLL